VRGCGRRLDYEDRSWRCAARHHFDVARSGYLNLLQPQDRRSAAPGDSRAAIEARASLLARGVGRVILEQVADAIRAIGLPAHCVVVDLGCGSGELLGAVAATDQIAGIGIDLSSAAANRAAKAFPTLTWIVANADRRLPILDSSTEVVVSMHGRRSAAECARILRPGGHLLVVVPAADDLIELRENVLGARVERDRSDLVITEHAHRFSLVSRAVARERQRLERDALEQLLRGTYRGERIAAAAAKDTLSALEVTLASDLLLFRRS
jgi:23S rRNA (guanine745-N1)-methyltransferase